MSNINTGNIFLSNSSTITNSIEQAVYTQPNPLSDMAQIVKYLIVSNKKTLEIPKEKSKFLYWRRKVIKIIGTYLMENHNNNPDKKTKESYTIAIVEAYPELKNDSLLKGYV